MIEINAMCVLAVEPIWGLISKMKPSYRVQTILSNNRRKVN